VCVLIFRTVTLMLLSWCISPKWCQPLTRDDFMPSGVSSLGRLEVLKCINFTCRLINMIVCFLLPSNCMGWIGSEWGLSVSPQALLCSIACTWICCSCPVGEWVVLWFWLPWWYRMCSLNRGTYKNIICTPFIVNGVVKKVQSQLMIVIFIC
jgi:hypothetical protein